MRICGCGINRTRKLGVGDAKFEAVQEKVGAYTHATCGTETTVLGLSLPATRSISSHEAGPYQP